MKKFFGILLAAVSALVLLPGCGGGGDQEEATRMTVEQFASGSKYFELRTGNGTVIGDETGICGLIVVWTDYQKTVNAGILRGLA